MRRGPAVDLGCEADASEDAGVPAEVGVEALGELDALPRRADGRVAAAAATGRVADVDAVPAEPRPSVDHHTGARGWGAQQQHGRSGREDGEADACQGPLGVGAVAGVPSVVVPSLVVVPPPGELSLVA